MFLIPIATIEHFTAKASYRATLYNENELAQIIGNWFHILQIENMRRP